MSSAPPTPDHTTHRDRTSAGRAHLTVLLSILVVSALLATVLVLSPAVRWPRLEAFLQRDRLPYPGNAREIWDSRLDAEVHYWRRQIRMQDSEEWRADYAKRLDPKAPLQEIIARHVDPSLGVNKILDVGSGPLTSINRNCSFCEIAVTAVDPLADFFNQVLDKRGITPPVRPELGWGERLSEQFGEDRFDITYSRNAIDHSYDPIKCLEEMIRVTKKGRYVILEVNERSGTLERWTGLHQWDFFVARAPPWLGRHLFIEGQSILAVDVTSHFTDVAETTTLEVVEEDAARLITLVLRKRAD